MFDACGEMRTCAHAVRQSGGQFGVVEVGLNPLVAEVDVRGLQAIGAEAVVLVGDVGRAHEDVAGAGLDFLIADGEQRPTGADDEHFVIRMHMPALKAGER